MTVAVAKNAVKRKIGMGHVACDCSARFIGCAPRGAAAMRLRSFVTQVLLLLTLLPAGSAPAAPPAAAPPAASDDRPTLFDPTRHMRVAEVKGGMKGYGLSVFKGTKIERFEVEVLSVLVNFNPKHDVVLVRCSGANLEHTGSIQGMSGSPVYLDDGTGKFRMIGAFAFGWPLMKDPVGGVQPIEYMLQLHEQPKLVE